jgi:hypothetical protein
MMSIAIKVLGIALVLVGVIFPIWRLVKTNRRTKDHRFGWLMAIAVLAVFAGLALIMVDRITEFTLRGVGTIHAVTDQAINDAKTVSDLKTRVENQSATVDLVASQATKAKEMSELASAQTKEAGQKLESLNAAIKEADDALVKLREEGEFQTLVLSAENDDRPGFDELKNIAAESGNRFNKLAGRAWSTIFEAHSNPFSQGGFSLPWKQGVDPSKLSFAELSSLYKSTQSPVKPAVLEYIWKREDIPKVTRLDFMMDVMKTDSSLTAMEYAGRYFTAGTDQKIKPMALEYLSSWWSQHRQEFVGK